MISKIQEHLEKECSQYLFERKWDVQTNLSYIFLKPEGVVPVIRSLKESKELGFTFLLDLTAVDWLGKRTPRFEICYLLRSPSMNHSVFQIKVPLEEGEKISSITSLFPGANWPEREIFDLFGIEFINHPNLERIIMPDNFVGYPLRKDYPIEGFGQDYLIEDLLQMHVKEDLGGQNS